MYANIPQVILHAIDFFSKLSKNVSTLDRIACQKNPRKWLLIVKFSKQLEFQTMKV
jgi:hypothetical protein